MPAGTVPEANSTVAPPPSASASAVAPGSAGLNADLQAYLGWMRAMENQRGALRLAASGSDFQRVAGAFRTGQFTDPQLPSALRGPAAAVQQFAAGIRQAKPAVPTDCADLDGHYAATLAEEEQSTRTVLESLGKGDAVTAQRVARDGAARLEERYGLVNSELQVVFQARVYTPPFYLRVGKDSGFLQALLSGAASQ